MRNLGGMSWDIWFTYPDQDIKHFMPQLFFVCFGSMWENDLKRSACSNWKMYTLSGHSSLSLYVSVWACLSVDSGALMLKDVSSFFALRWAPLAVMLGCSDVTHVSLPNIQLRNYCAGWSKWHTQSLRISAPSLRLCRSLPVSHSFIRCYMHWKDVSWVANSIGFARKERNAAFTLKGVPFLSEHKIDWRFCCSFYLPFLIVFGSIATDLTCHILSMPEYP